YTYEKRKSSGANWKKHHLSLLYLLYEGRGHKESLLRLATVCGANAFTDMSQQLVSTANKLETHLAQAESLIEEGRVDASRADR
ncbi:MAG: hypothetical protein HY647_06325, partial [Acidobacteria bacterium]|nr:hypothetical protein [Acidobacteriota bacterium]